MTKGYISMLKPINDPKFYSAEVSLKFKPNWFCPKITILGLEDTKASVK